MGGTLRLGMMQAAVYHLRLESQERPEDGEGEQCTVAHVDDEVALRPCT